MECIICFNKFNEKKHAPKLINSCGHTFCISCINKLRKCAICKRDITSTITNFSIIEFMNVSSQKNKSLPLKEHSKFKDEVQEIKSELILKIENVIKGLKDQGGKETLRIYNILLQSEQKLMDHINDLEATLKTCINAEFDEINQGLNETKLKDDIKSKIKSFENFDLSYSFKSSRDDSDILIGSIVSGEQASGFDLNQVSILTPESSPYTDRFRSGTVKIQNHILVEDDDEHNQDENAVSEIIPNFLTIDNMRLMDNYPSALDNQPSLLTPELRQNNFRSVLNIRSDNDNNEDDDDDGSIGHIQVSGEMRSVYKGKNYHNRTGACYYFNKNGNISYLTAIQKNKMILR